MKRTRLSCHQWVYKNDWSDWVAAGLVEDGTHLKLSVGGGSHGFKSISEGMEDGVRIKWDGYVNPRAGRLDMNGPGGWRIFSNDPNASGVTIYTLAGASLNPSYYYYGDDHYWATMPMIGRTPLSPMAEGRV